MPSDRIFLDESILFSISHESPGLHRLWDLAKKGRCLLFASKYVIEKVRRNLHHVARRKRLETCLSEVKVVLEADSRLHCPVDLPDSCRAVLMAAISAGANYLLTGDREHLGKYLGQTIKGVRISSARDYLLRTEETRSPRPSPDP